MSELYSVYWEIAKKNNGNCKCRYRKEIKK